MCLPLGDWSSHVLVEFVVKLFKPSTTTPLSAFNQNCNPEDTPPGEDGARSVTTVKYCPFVKLTLSKVNSLVTGS